MDTTSRFQDAPIGRKMLNQVFISYRHEGPEHTRAVRRLGELLRQSEIPVALDQFLLDERPGGPDEGWPKWCEDCASDSACVPIVASQGWFAAYEKDENAPKIVPARLRAWHQFRPCQTDEQLVRWIADRLGLGDVEPPSVRWPALVEFSPDIADRTKKEWPAVVDLLAGRSRERILLYAGGTGLGKSVLVRQVAAYAKRLGIPVVQVDFKGGGQDVEAILGQFDLDLGAGYLPNFAREGAAKTHLLRKDLRSLRRPVLVIFDSYDQAAENKSVVDWLGQQFLAEVETALGLAVIVAGQQVPQLASGPWRELARRIPLQPITEIEHWEPWIERRYPGFDKDTHLKTVLVLAAGNPALVSTYCETIDKKG